jgi:hypothetical protein
MNSKQRVLATIDHVEPDRVPCVVLKNGKGGYDFIA